MDYNKANKILGLQPGANADQIKTAYRNLLKQNHPDKHNNSAQSNDKTAEINAAKKFLDNYTPRSSTSKGHNFSHDSWAKFYENHLRDKIKDIADKVTPTAVNELVSEQYAEMEKHNKNKFRAACAGLGSLGATMVDLFCFITTAPETTAHKISHVLLYVCVGAIVASIAAAVKQEVNFIDAKLKYERLQKYADFIHKTKTR